MWIATCTSKSSATDRQLSMAAGVVPQSSCSFSRRRRPRSARPAAAGCEALPLPTKPRFIGKASAAWSMRAEVPGAGRAGGGDGAGGRPGAAAEHGGDAADISASSICCGQMKWIWVSMPPAVRIMPSPAMTSVPGPMTMSTPGWISGIAGLADGGDAAVLEADVGLDDAPVVEDQRVGDHGVDRALRRACAWLWPMPSRITLPPPNFTSSP